MPARPDDLSAQALAFVTERHLATFSSVRGDGRVHAVPVGFTWDVEGGLARIITSAASQKARNASAGGPVAICQVDGARWLTLEGTARVVSDADRVADAERRYAARYRTPRVNPSRVVIEVLVVSVLGSGGMIAERPPHADPRG